MSPLTFRTSIRRPLLALLIVGGGMTMSPVHAALPIDGLLGDDDPTAIVGDALGGDLHAGDLLGGGLPTDALLGGDLLGGGLPTDALLGGDLLGGGLPTDALLGGDPLGGGLPTDALLGGGLPTDALLGGDLLGGTPLGGDDDDPQSGSAGVNDSDDADKGGISIAGIHIGMHGHLNSLEELTDPCDSLRGRIHTGIQGADLTLAKVLPAPMSCPDPVPGVDPAPPASNPRINPEVLPAALEAPGTVGRAATPAPAFMPPTPSAGLVPSVHESAPATSPFRGPLPRTGPVGLLQGPLAFGLLGLSGVMRAAIGRRRPKLS